MTNSSDNLRPARKRRALDSVPNQSLSCFRVNPVAKQAHPRNKFEPERRKEVAVVRKRGACLRCRWLKRKVTYTTKGILRIIDTISVTETIPAGRVWS